jgi:hypothetical protein
MCSGHQQRFTINVWEGLIGDVLVGPHELPRRLTERRDRNFLENDLAQLLEEVPLTTRQHMWFLHDGALQINCSRTPQTTLSHTDGLDELDLWHGLCVRQILILLIFICGYI